MILTTPPMALAADGNLEGLNGAKFGMSVEQVVAALGERCKPEILKDAAGREFVERSGRCVEANLEPETLSTDFEEAKYYFHDSQLSRIVLIHADDFLCSESDLSPRFGFAENPLVHLWTIYGPPDDGPKRAVKDIVSDYDGIAHLSAATFTFENSGRITAIHYDEIGLIEDCKSRDPIIINCPCNSRFTGIELVRNKSDSLVPTDRLDEIFNLFESSQSGTTRFDLRSLFGPYP